jgi:putative FmdB family regulatory protein
MPVFEYRCNECQTPYDVYFKTREDKDMIECPSCKSKNFTKKLSTFAASMGASHSDDGCVSGNCGVPSFGGCANGMCGLN